MKNPLIRRLPRELVSDLGKYLVIFLLMAVSISEISGFLVADESMIEAYNEGFEKYNIEDGNFTTEEGLTPARIGKVEDLGIRVYENFYIEARMDNGTTLRFYEMRDTVDLLCLMEGEFPEKEGEMVIDRMYADNNGLSAGDTLRTGSRTFLITGLVAFSDYSCLFASNNDMMFDSKQFGVAAVPKGTLTGIDEDGLVYRYSYKYEDPPENEAEEKEKADILSKELNRIVPLTDFIPGYLNQAIHFAGEDMGSDRSMMQVLLYIIIIIIAFVFVITTANTIMKESAVIGTLRAMGYTRREMIRHYMTLPVIVTVAAAVAGNVLGYTVMKDLNADLYYGSYSLPTYETRWNMSAFLETTLIPIFLMAVINYAMLRLRLTHTPLAFLRRDLRKKRHTRAVPLHRKIPFFTRFRLRVLFQNAGNYLMMAVGILFANFLLMFGMMLPSVLEHYQDTVAENMLCNYQYVLQLPAGAVDEDRRVESLLNMLYFEKEVSTDNPDAEKFSAYSLRTIPKEGYRTDDILIYGIDPDSRYVSLGGDPGDVFVSATFADKFECGAGSTVTLKEPYEDTQYSFTVSGVYPYEGALCLFLYREDLNERFGLGEETFTGYLSDTEITDINRKYIAQVIDLEALTKISRQLDISMGSMMKVIDMFALLLFMILIYLLSRIIIEKNAQPISMTKILGYTDREISGLYISATTIFVLIMLGLSLPLVSKGLSVIFRVLIAQEMTGWIPFYMSRAVFVKMYLIGALTYLSVAVLEMIKIRRIPMEEALKNAE